MNAGTRDSMVVICAPVLFREPGSLVSRSDLCKILDRLFGSWSLACGWSKQMQAKKKGKNKEKKNNDRRTHSNQLGYPDLPVMIGSSVLGQPTRQAPHARTRPCCIPEEPIAFCLGCLAKFRAPFFLQGSTKFCRAYLGCQDGMAVAPFNMFSCPEPSRALVQCVHRHGLGSTEVSGRSTVLGGRCSLRTRFATRFHGPSADAATISSPGALQNFF